MKKSGIIFVFLILVILIVGIILINYFFQEEKEPSYVLHEWGVLIRDSVRTSPLRSYVAVLKPIIYLYSDDDFNLSLSVDFENGEAMEVWPDIPTSKKISWNNFEISSNCSITPFPEQQWDMKEIYELGNYVVESANCITYKNTTSKILFYNGKIDYGDPITGYYVDLGNKKQVTLTNNLEQDISDIYLNYKLFILSEGHFFLEPVNLTLGMFKLDKLNAGETKTFFLNVSTYNFSEDLIIAWENQAKEFKQKLINEGLYTDEANKFMTAWEETFFGLAYGAEYTSNLEYRDGMNMVYVLPEDRYNKLFELETSIEPEDIVRIGVVYSLVEESMPVGTAKISGISASFGENCESYTNQIKIYCNPFLDSYDKELCNKAENNYGDNDCCHSKL